MMSDPKKPHNAANAMFGLDDVPVNTQPTRPEKKPERAQSGEAATGFGFPQAPTVSFGPARPQPAQPNQAPPVEPPRAPATDAAYRAGGPYASQPSQSPNPPQYVYMPTPPGSSGAAWVKWLLIAVLIVAVAGLTLGIMQGSKFGKLLSTQADQINLLTRRADASDQRYADLSARFQVTAERLGLTQQELERARKLAANTVRQQQQTVRQLNSAIAEKASSQQLNQLQSTSNSKFGELSGNIAGTQKDLDATKEALTGAKSELSGAIAHTHDELVALAHRTDRDYFEFHANKGSRQKIGSLQMQLLKTSTKHNLFTVNLFFDDKVSQRKNEAIDEPVFFYMQGAPSALELVVNKVGKNTISGYISAPKGFITNASSVLSARPNA
ncbi:MAG TPA: hypothetical protein VGX94_13650 [Terriglobia bacterium]|nr:hypothetical protein [Terriglobia bacterium]